MKTYRMDRGGWVVHLGWILSLVVAVALALAILAAPNAAGAPPAFIPILPLLAALLMLFFALRQAQRVDVHSDGSMEWIAPARRIRLQPKDVLSIAPAGSIGYLVLRHRAGRFRFLSQLTGFHELLTELKRRNPAVELRGC